MNWEDGLPLLDLLDRVNRVAVKMLPEGAAPDARVSPAFSERSFRRYQTLGCIDPPERPAGNASMDSATSSRRCSCAGSCGKGCRRTGSLH